MTEHRHVQYLPDGRVKIEWTESSITRVDGRTLTAADCEDPACPARNLRR